jgi:eukaryotic-like serine/threonine-protein kinase
VEYCPQDGAVLQVGTDPLVGRVLDGRYRLLARVGAGGMSSVYLARHTVIGRRMAIKTLRRDLASDPVQRDRFLREARAVNRINHDNIVQITDFGEADDGLVYLAMEFVDGVSLFKAMADAPFAPRRALHIAGQVARALARAHEMGVVHRDLKPDNVLLTTRAGDDDFVKVLDFGIAKIFDAPSLTGSQQIFGTPGYIAPEYIQSTHIDGRADLYSLGVILYEMVTGALPFDYEYPGDLLVKHVTEPPVRPRARLPGVSDPLEGLILRCLRKDPSERFADAHEFVAELTRVEEALAGDASSCNTPSGLRARPEADPASRPTLTLGRFASVPPRAQTSAGTAAHAAEASVADPPDVATLDVAAWRARVRDAVDQLTSAGLASNPDIVRSVAYVERAVAELDGAVSEHGHDQVLDSLVDGLESRLAWMEREAARYHGAGRDTPERIS